MADFANMNVSTDNEVSVYNTPDTTLVIDGSLEDSLNMNTSLIDAERGITPTIKQKPSNISLDNSAAFSIGETSSGLDNSFSSVKSQSTIRESPDGTSSVEEGEDLASDLTDVGSDLDTSVSDKPPSAYMSPDKAESENDLGKSDAPQSGENSAQEGYWFDEYTGKVFPHTVALLPSYDGAQVYLIGSVHFSSKSCDDVSQVIQAVQPHIVFVELCPSRYFYLHLDEATLLAETKNLNLAKIKQLIRTNGLLGGLLFAFLHNTSAQIAEQVGTAPGLEFRRAATEAAKIPKCMIHLGDRPLGTTLRRVIASLSWWDLIKLVFSLLRDNASITQEEIEKMKNHGMLDDLLNEMAEKLPAVRHVFLDERDTYMAHSLQLAAMQVQVDEKNNQVPCRVVGVVGIGHMKGIIEKWGKVSSEEVIPISQIPKPSITTRVLSFTISASFWGLVIYGVTRIGPIRRNIPSVNGIASFASSATNYFRR
ncbi:TraB domain-containing protein [Frankliniella fusca]|uniref:TraB domain-containing protein n=1 Tax=Frankliniella fusca TaxID=407009 RepID=A0AAE1HUM7_9NEOP|nr:TraB domain-containing protein [Frankliniella fusca]